MSKFSLWLPYSTCKNTKRNPHQKKKSMCVNYTTLLIHRFTKEAHYCLEMFDQFTFTPAVSLKIVFSITLFFYVSSPSCTLHLNYGVTALLMIMHWSVIAGVMTTLSEWHYTEEFGAFVLSVIDRSVCKHVQWVAFEICALSVKFTFQNWSPFRSPTEHIAPVPIAAWSKA